MVDLAPTSPALQRGKFSAAATMPLHLLGKKSWNVYNADNIARVQRDEAAAAAAEEAAEQHMQEVDAARRLAILRGETPPPLPEAEPEIDPSDKRFTRRDRDSSGFQSKKRKRAGEDDTDFEMRLARERAEAGAKATGELATKPRGGAVQEIFDKAGHIDLVGGPPEPPPSAGKNPEYEREAAKKKRELEDQFQMRFSNAAGRDGFAAGAPWYAKADGRRTTTDATTTATTTVVTKEGVDAETGMEAPSKDVWGNDDPKRKVRAVQRLNTDDPLAMMKTGAKRAREVEKERKREVEERERELRELRREERRREKRHKTEKRHNGRDEDDMRSRPHRSEHSARRHEGGGRDERRRSHRHDEPGQHNDRDRERQRDRGREEDRSRGRERDKSRRLHGDHEDRHRRRQRHHDDGEYEV